MGKLLGIEVYRGPSAIDEAPIVVVLTGFASASTNAKTGRMIQSYILRADRGPVDVWRAGDDGSVCGSCPLRSPASGGGGGCYVNKDRGPRAVWDAWTRGRYATMNVDEAAEAIAATGRPFRMGTYGDPGAVPNAGRFWAALIARMSPSVGHTGYTHRWRDTGASLRGLCMASVDSMAEAMHARAAGWATFRVVGLGVRDPMRGEARCPASAEAGKRVTCETCPMKCDGALRPGNVGRVIMAHGATAKRVR